MSLYLALLLCSLVIPLILSFDKKVAFYKYWVFLFPAVLVSAILFIAIDILFTSMGVWGFNPRYHSGIILAGLPLEEILFFIIIPYSSIFIHYVLEAYFPKAFPGNNLTRIITIALIAILAIFILFNTDRLYTTVYSLTAIVLLMTAFFLRGNLLSRFYISFPVILIPFIIVNGILTGTFIEEEVVWYNVSGISGIRLLTIPVEDIPYGFSLILLNLILMVTLQKRSGMLKSPGK